MAGRPSLFHVWEQLSFDLGPTTNGYGTENGDGVTDNIQKFYCKNNGVLFENSLIQVSLARFVILYASY